MLISMAFAQGAEGGGAFGGGGIISLLPLVLIFVVFYFLLIRPQQKKVKVHRQMVSNLRRGDSVVTGGGIIGKVTKVDGAEVEVEVATGVKVKLMKGTLADVRNKTGAKSSVAANGN